MWEYGIAYSIPTPEPFDDEVLDWDSRLFEVAAAVGDTTELSLSSCAITMLRSVSGGMPSQAMVITAGSSKGA